MTSRVITDWLDVTYSPENTVAPDIRQLLLAEGWGDVSNGVFLLLGQPGTIKISSKQGVSRISTSGSGIRSLESLGVWGEYLSILSDAPHTVTRLDAAYDLPVDASPIIAGLMGQYGGDGVPLGRKGLKASQVLSQRPDGALTGTFYAGQRQRSQASARVYDKAWQLHEVTRGSHPWQLFQTRYEVTARSQFGPTLRDAYLPEAIFWRIASPALLQAPEGVPLWEAGIGKGWTMKRAERLPMEVIRKVIDTHPVFDHLLELADKGGPLGREAMQNLLLRRLSSRSAAG